MRKGGVGVAAITAASGVATASTVTLKGKVVDHEGEPAIRRKVAVNEQRRDGIFRYADTDSKGEFSLDVNSQQKYSLGFYKFGGGQLHAPQLNGVPHIKGLGEHVVGSEDTDVGTLEVPRGFEVDVLVMDADGDPVQGADMDFRDESGYGGDTRLLSTNEDGYLVIENADFTGFEAAGLTDFSVTFSDEASGDSNYEYNDRFHITEPSTIKVQAEEGMSMQTRVNGNATPSETATSTSTTPSSTSSTEGRSTKETATDSPSSTSTTTSSKRGFLRNGDAAKDLEFVTNPLFLTVGGFALSVAGIVHQLIRG